MPSESPPPSESEARRSRLVADLASRLQPVCADWPAELFDALVQRIAEVTMKYDLSATAPTYDRRSADRMIEELKDTLQRSEAAREEQGGTELQS